MLNTGTDLQQLGMGVKLAVRQQKDALPRGHCVMARRQTFLCKVIIEVFFNLTFKVVLVPFPFAVCVL